MRFARYLYLALATIVVSTVSVVVPQKSLAADCPDTWGIKIPILEITMTTKTYEGVQTNSYASSLLSGDNRYTNENSGNRSNLQKIMPDLYNKLKALGNNAVWNSYYEIVNPKITSVYPPHQEADNTEMAWIFASPVKSWLMLYNRIGEGSEIHWVLEVSVKGCVDYKATSNTYKFSNFKLPSITLDYFFANQAKIWNNKYNFKDEELIRTMLDKNLTLLEKVDLNVPVGLQRLSYNDLHGEDFPYLIIGINPPGCVDSINPNSGPRVNPYSAIVYSAPCQAGLFADTMLGKDYDWVLFKTFTIDKKPAPTPTPRATPTQISSPTPSAAVASAKPRIAVIKSNSNKTTITCYKGKTIAKITGVKPICPSGYKKK